MAAIISVPINSDQQWHSMRADNVGCSEIGALFGCHDYITGFALAARKMGRLVDQVDDAVLRRGRLLEPVARQLLAEDKPDWRQIPAVSYYHEPAVRFGGTPDLFVERDGRVGVVQIKTVAPAIFATKWRNADGEIAPPLWIALQAMGEQYLTQTDFAVVAALVVGHGLSIETIEVPYLRGVVDEMRTRTTAFWELVERGELPEPDYGRDRGNLAAVFREDDGAELDLTGDNELPVIAAQLQAAQSAAKAAEAIIEERKAMILHRLGAAQRAKYAGGVITAKTVQRQGYHVPAGSYRPVRVKADKQVRVLA